MEGWIRIPKQLASYSSVSTRTTEDWLKNGLRFVKVGACRLTKPEWVDEFLISHEVSSGSQVDQIVDDVLRGI